MMVHYILFATLEEKSKLVKDLDSEVERVSGMLNDKKTDMEELRDEYKIILDTMELLESKIDNLSQEIKNMNVHLEELNIEKRKIEDIINNSEVIEIISVDEERNNELWNGLVCLNRDILMRLLKKLDDEKIRNIIGIGIVFYGWSRQRIFQLLRSGMQRSLCIINSWIGGRKKFNLLYKASKDGFTASAFHEKCDSKGATVTFITSLEDYVFGGYTPVSWIAADGWIEDDSNQAFLFSLKSPTVQQPTKFKLVKEGMQAVIAGGYGPRFVGDYSSVILCYNNSNYNGYSYTDLNDAYLNITGVSGTKIFTGQEKFTTKEIEVFSVSEVE